MREGAKFSLERFEHPIRHHVAGGGPSGLGGEGDAASGAHAVRAKAACHGDAGDEQEGTHQCPVAHLSGAYMC